jgi:hypothetical protein
MSRGLLFACSALAVLWTPNKVHAQFTDPHSYDNTPLGTNQLELAYAYARANASIDTSIIITGARVELNQGSNGYTRYFGFVHRLVWAEADLPVAGLGGSVGGTIIRSSITGGGDSSYMLAMLLKADQP